MWAYRTSIWFLPTFAIVFFWKISGNTFTISYFLNHIPWSSPVPGFEVSFSFCLFGFKFKHGLLSYGIFVHMHWPNIQRATSVCAEDPRHCLTIRKYRGKVLLSITSCLPKVPMGSQLLHRCLCPSVSSSSLQSHMWAVTLSPRGSIDYHMLSQRRMESVHTFCIYISGK